MQTRKGQGHLGLDARRPRDAASGRVSRQVLQQRRLADPGLATQDQHPTLTGPHAVQQSVEGLALAAAAQERWRTIPVRHGIRQAPCACIATCTPAGKVSAELTSYLLLAPPH